MNNSAECYDENVGFYLFTSSPRTSLNTEAPLLTLKSTCTVPVLFVHFFLKTVHVRQSVLGAEVKHRSPLIQVH